MATPSTDREAAKAALYNLYPVLRDDRNLLASIEPWDYSPGEKLFQPSDPVTHIYFLLSGSVQETGNSQMVRVVQPPRVFGLYDFLYQQPHTSTAEALTFCQVLPVDIRTFGKLLYYLRDLPNLLAPRNLIERMRTLPLLAKLNLTELSFLADTTRRVHYRAGEPIFNAQFGADQLYLIDQGQVHVTEISGDKVTLGNGAGFGYPTLDQSATAATAVDILVAPHAILTNLSSVDVLHEGPQIRRAVELRLIDVRVFADPEFKQHRKQLAGYVSHYSLPTNHLLVREGETTDSMWILMPGGRASLYTLDATGQALTTTVIETPNEFCEEALLAQTIVGATIEADTSSQWLRLHRQDFMDFVQRYGYSMLSLVSEALGSEFQPLVGKEMPQQRHPWLQDGEGVALLIHRHWFILLARTWFAWLVIGAILVGFLFIPALDVPPLWLVSLLSFAGVVTLLFLGWQLIDFWNDYLVVTNRRVVRQEKVLFSSVRLRETGLEQIRNVDAHMTFPGSWLGYGTVSVQTAGMGGTISFNYIPKIDLVKRTIDIQKAHRQSYRPAASKLEIQQRLEGRFGLKLVLPDRVRDAPARPKPVRRGWQVLLRPFANRREQRKARYQQDQVIWRKHWIVLVGELFWPVTLLIATLSFLLAELFSQLPWLDPAAVAPLNFLLAFIALVLLCVIAWRFVDWHNDTYEVTRYEVADVEKLPLFFDEKRRTARLLDIDNTRFEVPSTLHYLLNIGNVRLETAAVQGGFTFDTVFDPSGVVTEVRKRIEDARRREEQQRAEQRARELTDWFEIYNRLHRNQQP